MKVFNITILLIAIVLSGCKTQKIAPKPEPLKSETISKPSNTVISKPVTSKEETVSAANGEAKDFGTKKFYVILGSYKMYEGAQKFKQQLMAEDFFPGILVNEAGLFRVSVNSYDDEAAARSRIGEIRMKFPKYSDLWLLIKK